MNYLKDLQALGDHLVELESLFHGIFNVDIPARKDNVTSIKRYKVLKIIKKSGPQNLTGLCKFFHMRKNSCSELLDRMIKDELVDRIPSTKDRRKTYFHLTKKGEQLIRTFETHFRDRISTLFSGLPDGEVKRFVGALEVIIAAARKIGM